LLRAGVRLTSLIPPSALGHANDELRRNGIPFDLSQLKPEQIEELIEHLDEMTIEVDQAEQKVRVFCE
jgi:Asp-tRNA(Asn)/Glu-tRNA(Gln) amidotransferase B subunit